MLESWLIERPEAAQAWQGIQDRTSRDEVLNAMMSAGKTMAADMRERVALSPNECPTILVELRASSALGLGVGAALRGFNLEYFLHPQKKGLCSAGDIRLLRPNVHIGQAVWIVSAVNGENLHVPAALDSIQVRGTLETASLSHLIINAPGKRGSQTKLDRWQTRGYMHFLQEAGEDPIGSFFDEWETLDSGSRPDDRAMQVDERNAIPYELQEHIRKSINTGLGVVEMGKGATLYLLSRREVLGHRSTMPLADATWTWIRASLNLVEAKYRIELGLPAAERDFEGVLQAMVFDGLLTYEDRHFGPIYRASPYGKDRMSKVYLPILDGQGVRAKIDHEVEWLLKTQPPKINSTASAYRR